MEIAIIGSRNFANYSLLAECLNWFHLADISRIISGGAIGADSLAENYAENNGLECTVFRPDWNKDGKAAGFIRNQKIIDACDIVIAFWDGKSKGTKDSINKAKLAKKPTLIIYF